MRDTRTKVFWTLFASPIGVTYVASTLEGVCRVSVPQETRDHFMVWLHEHFEPDNIQPHPGPNLEAVEQLEAYFRGERKRFALHLDLRGTEFQQSVWNELLKVPYGQMRTYGMIAEHIGIPHGSQAVGAAIGQNPVLVMVPCHRVLGVDGGLTGYAGGVQTKRWLLQHEGALLL